MFPGEPQYRSLILKSKPVQRVVVRFTRELQRRPLVLKCLPTACGFAFGDCLTQYMNRKPEQPFSQQYDPKLTVMMFSAGALAAGPVLFGFGLWMDGHIMAQAPRSLLAVSTKFTLDQIVGCAIWQAAYLSICEGYRQGAQTLLKDTSDRISCGTEHLLKKAAVAL